jgi:broad specificity phosphatase PhoE
VSRGDEAGDGPGPSGVPAGMRMRREAPSRSTRVVLVRHGEARCMAQGVVGGPRGCSGLTDLGRLQAQALHVRLARTGELRAAVAFYASVLARAVETAQVVAPAVGDGSGPATDCDLCELHPGEADGMTWDDFRARYGEPDFDVDPDRVVAPGGESWRTFVRRAAGAVASVAERHEGGLVVVVCHAGVVESTMLSFLPVTGVRRLGLPTEHTSLTEWERVDGRWRLVRYNDAAHLRDLAAGEVGVPTAGAARPRSPGAQQA